MKKDINVAVIQANIPSSTTSGEMQISRLVKEASINGADLVGLPEDCIAKYLDIKNNGYDPLSYLSRVAKDNNVYLFGATLVNENNNLYNKGFIFNRNGDLLLTHNKIVLTPPEESDGITPGTTIEVVDTEFGKMALLVCKDSFHRYAAWFFDALRNEGVDIVLVPSYSINVSKQSPRSVEMWVSGLKALAIWFDVYIVAPGTIGKTYTTEYDSFGHALILSPNKVILAEGSTDKEEILYAKLDKDQLEGIRNTYGSKWQPQEPPKFVIKRI